MSTANKTRMGRIPITIGRPGFSLGLPVLRLSDLISSGVFVKSRFFIDGRLVAATGVNEAVGKLSGGILLERQFW